MTAHEGAEGRRGRSADGAAPRSGRVRRLPSPAASLALLLAVPAALLAGCGYTAGSLVPERYHTIAVPIFANDTRRHDLEYEVTQAVVEEMQARTNLRVVGEDDDPDLVLKGVLREASETVLSHEDLQRTREGAYLLTAEVDVTDRRGGSVIVKDRKVYERESYVPLVGEDVRTARAAAARSLAERIVRTLESAW